MTDSVNNNKSGKIVLLIFLLICSGLGIAAFVMSLTKKGSCKEGYEDKINNQKQIKNKKEIQTVQQTIKDYKNAKIGKDELYKKLGFHLKIDPKTLENNVTKLKKAVKNLSPEQIANIKDSPPLDDCLKNCETLLAEIIPMACIPIVALFVSSTIGDLMACLAFGPEGGAELCELSILTEAWASTFAGTVCGAAGIGEVATAVFYIVWCLCTKSCPATTTLYDPQTECPGNDCSTLGKPARCYNPKKYGDHSWICTRTPNSKHEWTWEKEIQDLKNGDLCANNLKDPRSLCIYCPDKKKCKYQWGHVTPYLEPGDTWCDKGGQVANYGKTTNGDYPCS